MRRMRILGSLGLASVLVFVGLGGAYANTYGTVQATFTDVFTKPYIGVTYYADTDSLTPESPATYEDTGYTYAGMYQFDVTSSTYAPIPASRWANGKYQPSYVFTFCIDLVQNIYWNGTYTYTVTDLDSAPSPKGAAMHKIDATQKANLQRLYYTYYTGNLFNNADCANRIEAAAFGLSVWEIVCEHWDTTYDVTQGSFIAVSAASARANVMLTHLGTIPSDVTPPELVALVNDTYQDQMWMLSMGGAPIIPEPLTLLGTFLGLGSLGAYIRRRRTCPA